MNPGDIVLIRFPQTDLQTGKLRPALVVAVAPGRHPDLLLALISSRAYQTTPDFDEIIEASDPDFETAGLKVRSVVRLARLASVEASIISARLGHISSTRLQLIRSRLIDWLQK
ncbi:MAG: type II toxin-antitoxin system PemK/MazF family toxin [Ardenticatenaceae bacterium]|nr:type II toxin-antitoxin system PemK/MazF family toxin [Ardenticatenaceae bacterium]MCB9443758.1 type II toxin-antitoxin system PemK/MazF family toxin [Ardenticatenaceae bacterium]